MNASPIDLSQADGPRVGRPITGGAKWWRRFNQTPNDNTTPPVNAPPETIDPSTPSPDIAQRRFRRRSQPWQNTPHHEIAMPVISAGATPPPDTGTVTHPIVSGETNDQPITTQPIAKSPPNDPPPTPPGVAPPTTTDGGGGSATAPTDSADTTTALENQVFGTEAQPLGGVGLSAIPSQIIKTTGGGSSPIAWLAIVIGAGALAFAFIRSRGKAKVKAPAAQPAADRE